VSACCSTFTCAADEQFNEDVAAQELKRYRDKGPPVTTRLLVEGIARAGALGGTVLDVGSGVGALALTLLERGAASVVAVDASSAYQAAAREEAERRGRAAAIRFVHADFVDASLSLAPARLVTLDRVVCCYPGYQELLDAAASHAEQCVAVSYPRERWYVRLAMGLENGRRRLARRSFRTFVHPARAIEDTIRRGGFTLSSRRTTWMWSADVYVRA
jgi:magnesium-protoporphyrin O-methyltransferase